MSTTTANFGLIKPELTDPADITVMNGNWDKIDEKLNETGGSNPNMLDNWYFADPINQRAQTSYSGTGYGIDRWTMIEADGTVTLASDGMTVYRQLRQYLENPNDKYNKQLTASVLTSDGTLHTGTMTLQNATGGQMVVDNTNIHLYLYVINSSVSFIIECRSAVKIFAAKLEFGSKQTLARQGADGKWVLADTPPNKTLETIKCNSSTDDATDAYANKVVASTVTYTATVSTGWTSSGDYFYKDVTVSGIIAKDNPIVDINPGSDNAANELYSESICKVFRITTSANSIRLWATEAIETAFPIQLKVVR